MHCCYLVAKGQIDASEGEPSQDGAARKVLCVSVWAVAAGSWGRQQGWTQGGLRLRDRGEGWEQERNWEEY